jgi:hypothetical protein
MSAMPLYQSVADAVLLFHFSVVGFIVIGLVLIYAGNFRGWHWVNNFWFRIVHLVAISVVVVQSWLGQDCPLTILESWLRQQAGRTVYHASFIEHWIQRILFYEAPFWVFLLMYSLFGLLVMATWWYFPPTRGRHRGHNSAT